MGGEEVRVIVARAQIENNAAIEGAAPKTIRVRAKQPLRVQFLFHVEEGSRAREQWRFLLQSAAGGQAKAPVRSESHDHWGYYDRFWGTLEQTFQFDRPGTYPAGFHVEADYERLSWKDRIPAVNDHKELTGAFVIEVDP